MVKPTTTLIRSVVPSAPAITPSDQQWNHDIAYAKHTGRTWVEYPPTNGATFGPTSNNTIQWNFTNSDYIDFRHGWLEFSLNWVAGPTAIEPIKDSMNLIERLEIQSGGETLINEVFFGEYHGTGRIVGNRWKNVYTGYGHSDYSRLETAPTTGGNPFSVMNGERVIIPLDHPFFTQRIMPFKLMEKLQFKLILQLASIQKAFRSTAAGALSGAETYTISDVVLHYTTLVPPKEVQMQHNDALCSQGLMLHCDTYEHYRFNPTTSTFQANITTANRSIKYIFFYLRDSALVDDPTNGGLGTWLVTGQRLDALLPSNVISNYQFKANGHLVPTIPINSRQKQFFETSKVFDGYVPGVGINGPPENAYFNFVPAALISGAGVDWSNKAVYAFQMADDHTGLISGFDNHQGRGQLVLDISFNGAADRTLDVFVVHDVLIEFKKDRARLIK